MKYILLVCLICLMPAAVTVAQNQAITLDHVTGLYNTGSVIADGSTLVVFYIRFTNNEANPFKGITNGFRVYSPNGATWTTTATDTLPVLAWKVRFDLVFQKNLFSIDGSGADTVGWGGTGLGIGEGKGIPENFNNVVYSITSGPIGIEHHGKTICIDSSFYPPAGTWKWAGGFGIGDRWPTWDGPHCFTVIDPTAPPIMGASVSSVEFTVEGSQPEDQVFTILLSDESTDKTVDVSGALDIKAGGDLTFTPSSGTHGTEITVSLDASGLAIGDYTGTITLSSSETFNPTFEIGVDVGVTTPLSVWNLTDENALPTTFALGQNYPNPFNPTTEVAFDLPTRTHVTLTVYNVLGQQVATLVNEQLAAGSYVADWDGRSAGGNAAASGIYFYRLQTGQFAETKKMVLLK